jgi:perosamine synthetase
MTDEFIPVCEPTLQGNELKYVTEAVSTGWISSGGSYIKKFEETFAAYCGVKHGVSCSNGTTALHLAIEALKIGKGDEVIIPTFTMIASANAVVYAGATPVLIDAELDTWNMNIDAIEAKITPRTKAIMIVHTYGHPIDMDRVRSIANRHNLFVIEDAAEAHGAEYKGRKIGSLSDVACFSFYGNKMVTSGEGGMVIMNNEEVAERARKLRNHFFGTPRFVHEEIGYNYRLTNVQAAIGLAQVEKLDDYVEMRRNNAKLYNELLKDVPGVTLPPEKEWAKNVYWMYGILIQPEFGMSMQELSTKLKEVGVDSRTFFVGMHNQPCYQGDDPRFPDCTGNYPNSDELQEKGLYLPSASHLTPEQITRVADAIKKIQGSQSGSSF